MNLPFDPVTPFLGLYPKEPKTLIRKNIITPMFIAALFTIAKIWKQPINGIKYPLIDDKTTTGYLHNGILFRCKKRYPLRQYALTWRTLC